MTKQQMMAGFDELLTDRRLTRARAEQQLAACAHDPGLLDDRYVCLASGGSSGVRGLFVQTAEEYVEFAASVLRPAMARVFAAGGPPPGGLPVTIVAAASPVHSSGFAAAVARGYPVRMISVPATLPTGEIVRRLNDAQPPVLLAHTSTLALLAGEQRAGRLRISPQAITAMSELLTDRTGSRSATRSGCRRSTSSSRPRGWSATASREARCSASPPTCASPSSSTPTTGPLRTARHRPRYS